MSESLWRILDANLNRCNEGFRVLEDWCRFVADQGQLSGRLKDCRHQLQSISGAWPVAELLSSRDSVGDVGRTIGTDSEYQRVDDLSLLQANFSRVQQSLRVLEETAKRLQLPSHALEALRYQSYDLHKEVVLLAIHSSIENPIEPLGSRSTESTESHSRSTGLRRRELLAKAKLYVLTDLCGSLESCTQHVQRLIDGGADVIQLRDKSADDRDLLVAAVAIANLCRQADVLFVMNDRPDIAVAADADGVHVGQEELPVEVVRQLVGSERLIGLSTHDPNQVAKANDSDCDYIGVGPVFTSKTKSFDSHVGTDLLRQVSAMKSTEGGSQPKLTKPAFAIGGIAAANLQQVIDAGFDRVAVQNAVGQGEEVVQRGRALKTILQRD